MEVGTICTGTSMGVGRCTICTETRVCLRGNPQGKLACRANGERPMTCLVQLLELRKQGLLLEVRGQLYQNQQMSQFQRLHQFQRATRMGLLIPWSRPRCHVHQDGSQGQGRRARDMACWCRDLSIPQVSHIQLCLRGPNCGAAQIDPCLQKLFTEFYRGWRRTFRAS